MLKALQAVPLRVNLQILYWQPQYMAEGGGGLSVSAFCNIGIKWIKIVVRWLYVNKSCSHELLLK